MRKSKKNDPGELDRTDPEYHKAAVLSWATFSKFSRSAQQEILDDMEKTMSPQDFSDSVTMLCDGEELDKTRPWNKKS